MKSWVAIALLVSLPLTSPAQTTRDDPPALAEIKPDVAQVDQILIPGKDWKLVAQDLRSTDGPAVNAKGEVFFNDGRSGKTLKIGPTGALSDFVLNTHRGAGEAFGVDGRLYSAADDTDQIIATDATGRSTVFADALHGNDLTIAANGNMYVTQSPRNANEIGKLWLVSPSGEKKIVDPDFKFPNGLALSPDQTVLYVGDYRSHWVYSYQIKPDGTLDAKQKFSNLYVPEKAPDAADDGMRVDRDGRLYVTTRAGIQICDPAGRVICVLPTPNGRVSNLTFGGADLDTIYATCGDKIFSRKLKTRGVLPFEAPIKTAPSK